MKLNQNKSYSFEFSFKKESMVKEECEGKGDEFELSLELSIGGSYGKSEGGKVKENIVNTKNEILGSDFCNGIGDEILNLQRRKEIQAMKRQEARKKREEKMKKSRGWNSHFGEPQKFQATEELGRKKHKLDNNINNNNTNELNLSVVTKSNGYNPIRINYNDLLEGSCSSAVSEYSQIGGSNSDGGSIIDQADNNTCSSDTSGGGGGLNAAASMPPRVSTTGNGPNGKTIHGLLYKYNNAEVKILCVCHGRWFSPVEFVEHAGGVDILHPLRHIIVAFRSPC